LAVGNAATAVEDDLRDYHKAQIVSGAQKLYDAAGVAVQKAESDYLEDKERLNKCTDEDMSSRSAGDKREHKQKEAKLLKRVKLSLEVLDKARSALDKRMKELLKAGKALKEKTTSQSNLVASLVIVDSIESRLV
jgi:hypothetical protein